MWPIYLVICYIFLFVLSYGSCCFQMTLVTSVAAVMVINLFVHLFNILTVVILLLLLLLLIY